MREIRMTQISAGYTSAFFGARTALASPVGMTGPSLRFGLMGFEIAIP